MGSVTVVGVGFEKDQLTLRAAEMLKSGARIILHTERCGVAEYLKENGIEYTSLDELYEQYEDFDEHAEAACDAVEAASEGCDVVYCVMDVRDLSACMLAENGAEVIPGPSAEGMLMTFASGGTQLYSASDWENIYPDGELNTIVREIDTRELSCEVKLKLMETYPDDADCIIMCAGGMKSISLHELDRQNGYDHRFSVLVKAESDAEKLNSLTMRKLVEAARANDGVYKEADFAEISDAVMKAAGAIAYAEDRGEFNLADIMLDARDELMV